MVTRAPALPTYQTAAGALEGHNGEGLRLIGYTFARTLLIAPMFIVLGMETRKAFLGAFMASALMSTFVVLRIFDTKQHGLMGVKRLPAARHRPRRR
jgi:hypothetical protein